MDRDVAKEKFREADRLFNERQYAKALEILSELDRTYPNQRAVLFPMARCLAGLRRLSEAIDLADRIARDFEYGPAAELKTRLQDKHARISSMPPANSISSFDPPANTPKPAKPIVLPRDEDIEPVPAKADPEPERETQRTPVQVAAGVCAGLVLLSYGTYAGVGATVANPAVTYLLEGTSDAAAPWQELMFLWVGSVVHLYLLACIPMYAAVKFAGGLQHDTFGDNLKDAATVTLYGFLLAPIVLIGWIVFFVLLRRHFGMGTGHTMRAIVVFGLLFAVVCAVDWALLSFVLHPALAG